MTLKNTTCEKCGHNEFEAYKDDEEAVIKCTNCGEEIFRYGRKPERVEGHTLPELVLPWKLLFGLAVSTAILGYTARIICAYYGYGA